MSAVKIKKHVNLSSPLLPELVACLLMHFFSCLPVMYKGGKNHIKPTDFLNFYMSEKGREGGRWKSKGISKFGEVRECICGKVNILS